MLHSCCNYTSVDSSTLLSIHIWAECTFGYLNNATIIILYMPGVVHKQECFLPVK